MASAGMQKPFATFQLNLAAAAAQLAPRLLDAEQQGRLALAWMQVWASGHARGAPEDVWASALGYLPGEWAAVRERFAAVLDRGEVWALPFMLAEADRQGGVSKAQRDRIGSRWKPHATGGIPAATGGSRVYTSGVGVSAGASEKKKPSAHTRLNGNGPHPADDPAGRAAAAEAVRAVADMARKAGTS